MAYRLALVALLLVACDLRGNNDLDVGNDGCVPGQSIACVGPGGCAGGQECNKKGDGYGECVCGAPVSPDAGSTDTVGADAGTDTRAPDAAPGAPDATPVEPECETNSDCEDGDDCIQNICGEDGQCYDRMAADGLAGCSYGNGKCYGGECCTGCWNGSECITARSVNACGYRGEACENCDDGNPCTNDTCYDSVACQRLSVSNGTPCPGGTCQSRECVGAPPPAPCGDEGEGCCLGEEDRCNRTDLVCVYDSETVPRLTCKPCGDHEEDCCRPSDIIPSSCNGDLICYDGQCECGHPGQRCCNDSGYTYCWYNNHTMRSGCPIGGGGFCY